MINLAEATAIITKNLPGSQIQKTAEYGDKFLFLVDLPDEFPVFFSVNRKTKEFSDFSPWADADPAEIERLFLT
jgi:hypothetical protein